MKVTTQTAALLFSSICAADSTSFTPFYGEAWGGPVQIAENLTLTSNSSSGFDLVEATLVIPHLALPKTPREQVEQYTSAFWLGMDGVVSDQVNPFAVRGLWQAGIIMSLWTNESVEYKGFHEWIPEDPIFLSTEELSISEGDHIYVAVSTIMEAGTYVNGPQYVLPNWGNTTFLDARACYSNGRCINAGDANANPADTLMTIIFHNENQTVNTESYADGDQVWITYVEEPFSG
ncbi:hypothetical protein IFR05_008189 [Cadophora sp. M221]|nr:hypothetical protein IFR05_008189 [Cadophora sp. M221]